MPPAGRLWSVLGALARSKAISTDVLSGHCEVAERFGARLGFDPRIVRIIERRPCAW